VWSGTPTPGHDEVRARRANRIARLLRAIRVIGFPPRRSDRFHHLVGFEAFAGGMPVPFSHSQRVSSGTLPS
jgi:hypothetical protein